MDFSTLRLFTEPEQRGSGLAESPLLVLFALEVHMFHREAEGVRYPSRRPATGGKSLPHISRWAEGIDGHLDKRRYSLEWKRRAERHESLTDFPQAGHLHKGVGILGQRQNLPVCIVRWCRIFSGSAQVFDDNV